MRVLIGFCFAASTTLAGFIAQQAYDERRALIENQTERLNARLGAELEAHRLNVTLEATRLGARAIIKPLTSYTIPTEQQNKAVTYNSIPNQAANTACAAEE